MPDKRATIEQFAAAADAYVTSPGHAAGRDLERLVELLDPAPHLVVLDVATGAGHTALAVAPHVRAVVASDLTAAMAERAQSLASDRGVPNLVATVADVERLPWADASFDAVTCRIAPHHFDDLDAALREVARVLVIGGRFVVEDSTVPEDPAAAAFLNRVEAWRDPTHVRSLPESEWRARLREHGFTVGVTERHRKRHELQSWFERSATPPAARQRVIDAFASAPPAVQQAFSVELDGRTPVAYSDDKLLLVARRP